MTRINYKNLAFKSNIHVIQFDLDDDNKNNNERSFTTNRIKKFIINRSLFKFKLRNQKRKKNIESREVSFTISHYFITLNCQSDRITKNKTLSKNREEFDFKNVISTLDSRDCSEA